MTMHTDSEDAGGRQTRYQRYTRWVETTCRDDPGARIALRKGLRRGLDDALYIRGMHRLVSPWLPHGPATNHSEQRAYYTIASLIAAQPRHSFTRTPPSPNGSGEGTDAATDTPATPAVSGPQPAVPPPGQAAAAADTAPAPGARSYGTSLGVAFARAVTGGAGREREMKQSAAETRLNLLTRQSLDGLHRHLPATVRYLQDFEATPDWAQLMTDLVDWPVLQGRIARRWLQDFYWQCAKAERDKANRTDATEAGDIPPQA